MAIFFRALIALALATLVTSMLGSIFSSQFVINELLSIGAEISFPTRLSMTFDDFGILPALGAITAICFVIAFSVAALCVKFFGGNRALWYVVAGASGLMLTLLIMKALVLITAIAGTRSTLGFLSFGLAGAIGGWVFATLSSRSIKLAESAMESS